MFLCYGEREWDQWVSVRLFFFLMKEWVYDFFFFYLFFIFYEVTSVYSSGLRFENFKNLMLLNVSSGEKMIDLCENNK